MIISDSNPLISIIVPVYNAESYLEQCLGSILSQDVDSMEIIAVDDGSSDQSASILDRYSVQFGIIVIHQQNGGASRARNKALTLARGKYVGFVDADDWIEPHMYKTMCNVAEKEDADIVLCNIYRNQTVKLRKYFPGGVYRGKEIEDVIYPILISSLQESLGDVTLRSSTWCRIFRRDLIVQHGILYDEDLIYNEDGLFCIQATLASNCYVYLDNDFLYHNRYVAESLTKRYIPQLWERQRNMVDKLNVAVSNTSYDFSIQIDKKLMDIAVYCIENECKPDNDAPINEVSKRLRSILEDIDLQRAIRNIPLSSLKRINKAYWWAIRFKSVGLVLAVARHRQEKANNLNPKR